MKEIRQLNSQPFTKRHSNFPIILESVTCQVLLQWSTALELFWFEQ